MPEHESDAGGVPMPVLVERARAQLSAKRSIVVALAGIVTLAAISAQSLASRPGRPFVTRAHLLGERTHLRKGSEIRTVEHRIARPDPTARLLAPFVAVYGTVFGPVIKVLDGAAKIFPSDPEAALRAGGTGKAGERIDIGDAKPQVRPPPAMSKRGLHDVPGRHDDARHRKVLRARRHTATLDVRMLPAAAPLEMKPRLGQAHHSGMAFLDRLDAAAGDLIGSVSMLLNVTLLGLFSINLTKFE